MSTLTLQPSFARPAVRRPRKPMSNPTPVGLRLTRRGRAAFVLLFTVALLAIMAMRGGFAVASLDSGSPEPVRIIQVQPGDTLFGIAGELAAPGHVRDMVRRIQELNSLPDDGSLQVGIQLAVPKG